MVRCEQRGAGLASPSPSSLTVAMACLARPCRRCDGGDMEPYQPVWLRRAEIFALFEQYGFTKKQTKERLSRLVGDYGIVAGPSDPARDLFRLSPVVPWRALRTWNPIV